MRRLVLTAILVSALLPGIGAAQITQWPEYSSEQRWDRMARLGTLGMVAAIAYVKEQNADLEEFGEWWGDLFAPGWGQPGAYGPFEVMRGMRRNFLSWPGMEFAILSESETAVSARLNRPWTEYFGEGGTWYGVTLAEYERLNSQFFKRIADYHGLAFEERRDGDKLVITYSRR